MKPQKRIHVTLPKKNHNPYYLGVSVSDKEARDAVNKIKDEPWARGDSIFAKDRIIEEESFSGYLVVNKCFDVEEVARKIESLLANNQ